MAASADVVTANVLNKWTVTEKLVAAGAATDLTLSPTAYNPAQRQFTPTSTVKVSKFSHQALALVGGAKTIDLTALAGTVEGTIDGTGLLVQGFWINGHTGNAALTISPGAANPYVLFGAGNSIVYPAGCTEVWPFLFQSKLAAIAAGVKNIDLAGAGVEIFDICFLLGAA